jgi:hypothetical protein
LPVYADREDNQVNQGDLFVEVPFPVPMLGDTPLMGMVISHDCECDKFLKPRTPLSSERRAAWRLTVACAHPVDMLPGGTAKAARQDEMPRYLHLPEEADVPELVVDLWTEQPVRMVELLECDRVASLSAEFRNRLWWKIIRLRLGESYQSILEGNIPPDAA